MMKHSTLLISLLLLPLSLFAQRMDDKTTHSQYIQAVDEYRPAPGQFINTMPKWEAGDDAQKMADKCTALLAENKKGTVCLGAWGGYITFHFDHSIYNVPGELDIYFMGNATKADFSATAGGSCEPGIVMVSKDENKNGLPDDLWYEISGSGDRDSIDKMVYNYSVTYTKQAMQDVPWTDNKNGSGVVPRNGWHDQEYFPQWIESPLTFTGTLLPKNGADEGTAQDPYWVLRFYDYGYVDNKPNKDSTACSINFDWAVDPVTREHADIDFVDFVRVYTGMQQVCGWLGETSTELLGAHDLHLDASLEAIKQALTNGIKEERGGKKKVIQGYYSLDGRQLARPEHGINILRYNDGSVRKVVVR